MNLSSLCSCFTAKGLPDTPSHLQISQHEAGISDPYLRNMPRVVEGVDKGATGSSSQHLSSIVDETICNRNEEHVPLNHHRSNISEGEASISNDYDRKASSAFVMSLPSVPETRPAADLSKIISLVQDLMTLSASKRKQIIPKAMAVICSRLNLSYASLSTFSSSGKYFQVCGTCQFLAGEKLKLAHPAFLACMEGSDRSLRSSSLSSLSDPFLPLTVTKRRTSSSSREFHLDTTSPSFTSVMITSQTRPEVMDCSEVLPLEQCPSLEALLHAPSGTTPLTGEVTEDASNLQELYQDWQVRVRKTGLRSFLAIPIRSSHGPLGCLTLGSMDALTWSDQSWYGGLQLLIGWAVTALSQNHRSCCIEFFESLSTAADLEELASAFVHTLPASLRGDELRGKVETRLALVSSRLSRAMIYARDPNTVSRSLGNSVEMKQYFMPVSSSAQPRLEGPNKKSVSENGSRSIISLKTGKAKGSVSFSESHNQVTFLSNLRTDVEGSTMLNQREVTGDLLGKGSIIEDEENKIFMEGNRRIVEPQIRSSIDADSLTSAVLRLRNELMRAPETEGQIAGDENVALSLTTIPAPSTGVIESIQTQGAPADHEEQVSQALSVATMVTSQEPLPRQSLHIHSASSLAASPMMHMSVIRKNRQRTITAAGAEVAGLMQIGEGSEGEEMGESLIHNATKHVYSSGNNLLVPSGASSWGVLSTQPSFTSSQGAPSHLPLDCISIPTDGTLLMNALEAGEAMAVKDSHMYSGKGRKIPTDIDLAGRTLPKGTLLLLPLVHKSRSLGCVYIFIRSNPKSVTSLMNWADLTERISRCVFKKLSGELRPEWADALSDEPSQSSAIPSNSAPLLALSPQADNAFRRGSLQAFAAVKPPQSDSGTESASGQDDSLIGKQAILEAPDKLSSSAPLRDHLPHENGMVNTTSAATFLDRGSIGPWRPTSVSLPNAPGSGLSKQSASTAAALHNPAIGRVLKVEKLYKPYVSKREQRERERQAKLQQQMISDSGDMSASSCTDHQDIAVLTDDGGAGHNRLLIDENGKINEDGGHRRMQTLIKDVEGSEVKMSMIGMENSSMHGTERESLRVSMEEAVALMLAEEEPLSCNNTILNSKDGESDQQVKLNTTPLPRDLQLWPELVEVGAEVHSGRRKSLYTATFQGRRTIFKALRCGGVLDLRSLPSAQHCSMLSRVAEVCHPNLLQVLVVYPMLYELLHAEQGMLITPRPGGSFTGVPPRRGKFRRCFAQLLEYVPSVSLREALVNPQSSEPSSPSSLIAATASKNNQVAVPQSSSVRGALSHSQSGVLPKHVSLSVPALHSLDVATVNPDSGIKLPLKPHHLRSDTTAMTHHTNVLTLNDTNSLDEITGDSSYNHNDHGSNNSIFSAIANSASDMQSKDFPSSRGPQFIRDMTWIDRFRQKIHILQQVASAVQALHEAGLLHGEIRAENVLLVLNSKLRPSAASIIQNEDPGGVMYWARIMKGYSSVGSRMNPCRSSACPQDLTSMSPDLSMDQTLQAGLYSTSSGQPSSNLSTAHMATLRPSSMSSLILAPRTASASSLSPVGPSISISRAKGSRSNSQTSRKTLKLEAFPVDVKVKLKDAAMCTLSPAKGQQLLVQKAAGRPRPSLLNYLAPELLQGQRPRRSSDTYSFGLLMWELYRGETIRALRYSNSGNSRSCNSPSSSTHLMGGRALPLEWPDDCPPWYRHLTDSCCSMNPLQRPSFRRILEALCKGDKSSLASSDESKITTIKDSGQETSCYL
ncbi:hypothetical protein CEUSTIGMA_g13376.t1 [Chlamydomonas eustigma]|uniref:Protein kinase domain-containing protein n=1 Tax=Chlamydomonas eustigma TaxID=1157962 RepID=A0A250XT29_9CHLO|nr:hypothetical protein CEUSTIGMA_g13376.t1 [Chlamydomonas eustigma]|eukprot:GAX85960.1 hypothetical protein CEUSTIGMA_g13376.t1 [Chlamydomonas eustigma]